MSADSERPFKAGDVLAGKYRIERLLGEGGMGVVAAATHIQLEQLVAIKFVLPSMLESKTVVERFLREARAAVRLRSEHVAKVLDVGTLEMGAPYMVMEYLEGQDLGQILTERGPLPYAEAADYIVQACEAVAEAHSLGIVHRDIKPQNLFVTTRVGGAPLVKVLDFGISKMTSEAASGLTQTQTTIGSPLYMAPEQMRSARNVDGRADIWALGVVLYKLVSGEVPFEADTMPALCYKVVHDPPRPLLEARPDAPVGLAQIVSRCLEKDPEHRYADIGELAMALEGFAPMSAFAVAERARSISAGARGSLAGLAQLQGNVAPTQSSSPSGNRPPGTQPIPTLSSWGDTKGASRSHRSGAVLGILAFLIMVSGITFIGMRVSARFGFPSLTPSDPGGKVAGVAGTPDAAAPIATPIPVATPVVATVAPPPSSVPASPPSAPLAVTPPVAPPRPPPLAPARPSRQPGYVPASKPSKPASSSPDDEIPSLR